MENSTFIKCITIYPTLDVFDTSALKRCLPTVEGRTDFRTPIPKTMKTISIFVLMFGYAQISYAQTDCTVQTDIPQIECEALVALFTSTNGPGWTTNTGWNVDNSPCGWHGVTCLGGSVSRIQVSGNNLMGPLPPELGNLGNLVYLNLSVNQLSDPLPPALGNLGSLENIILSQNQLSGMLPPELGNLSNLEALILGTNQFSGAIPATLGNLGNLQYLGLDFNQLSGMIPAALGNLSNLLDLSLRTNQLSGMIPAALGNLSNLTGLLLDVNQLSGEIPAALGNLSNLSALFLQNNQLEGDVPLAVAQLGAGINCRMQNNPSLCMPDTPPYQAIGDPICGINLGDFDCTTLPVELTDFRAIADGAAVQLTWETASETNNSGFSIEQAEGPDWSLVDFVEGHGTTFGPQSYSYRITNLEPGSHRFRLKQVDFDGSFAYSPEVEAELTVPGTYALSEAYPNPFGSQTRLQLHVKYAQSVRVSVYDGLGRLVGVLHEGMLAEGAGVSLVLRGAGHPAGLYVIRAEGETFQATRTVVLMP